MGASLVAGAVAVLSSWVLWERRTPTPLVDPGLLIRPTILRANTAMLSAGIGMYLLFSLLTRYVQTPTAAGYGFGLSGVLAGAALIPFSVLGFVAGRLTTRLAARVGPRGAFVVFSIAVVVAAGVFAGAPDSVAATLAAMAVLGFGVGGASAIMPRLVLAGVPQQETASVLSINQIVRTVGFSIGSALAGLLLAAATPSGELLPELGGYRAAAAVVAPLLLVSAVIIAVGKPSPITGRR
ncbi:MFS transporter [Gordonia phthalatica]|uniref:MFS transporter n=1 Tax=Gordonia phthalatica TaxID=1136941 RepID=UPI001D043E57|nr:MFS transporter [Gordonia phthalatica]